MPKETRLHETEETIERVILVGVENETGAMTLEACLDELEELTKTAGAVCVGRLSQKREKPHPVHYLGKGKIEELEIMINAFDATGIVCDDELSPTQIRNLEKMLSVKIMDRTMVILDIFASRAKSSEGKIQVELAQLKYRLSRLTGIGASMSRLGGGIGTRGPGEKKLETDRRYINDRISELKSELLEIKTHRELLRTNRNKKGITVVSLVGYTNAGKSTILNNLTDAGVLAEDKLFATLDITTRTVKLPEGTPIFLSDTVGFIQKLSHHLVEAFKATLDELKYADILLHIVDASNPNNKEQIDVVYKTLKELGCEKTPVITVFNKIDKQTEFIMPKDTHARDTVKISAKYDKEMTILLTSLESLIKSSRNRIEVVIPYSEGRLINTVHEKCEVVSEEHIQEGYLIVAYVDEETKNRLYKYKI